MAVSVDTPQRELLSTFQRDGYAIVKGALSKDEIHRLTAAVDRVYAAERSSASPTDSLPALHLLAFCGRDAAFLELLDHPAVLPRIVELLGPNIFMYHCHLDVHPPNPDARQPWMWHQDGGIVNRDLEGDPRPRLSVKVGWFLTDVSEPGRGNLVVLPASHLRNAIERPPDDDNGITGAVPILAKPGDAVLFDRRLWHMRSPNDSDHTRKALFYSYTYRWIRPRDDLHVSPALLPLVTPVRAQLLGAASRAMDYWMPDEVELPVRRLLS